ncbi:MAG: hypothetical protein WC238_04510 [Parcubacteria group bacterium]|jgi:hypothetical protein
MAYRYTSTDKWNDAWFSNLSQLQMLLFMYLCDTCDHAGFKEINLKRIASDLSSSADTIKGAMEGLSRSILWSRDGDTIYLRNFLKHQKNLPLNPANNAHKGILDKFELYAHKFDIQDVETFIQGAMEGLESPTGNGNGNGNGRGKGKEREKEKENTLIYPFDSDTFKKVWQAWKDYKTKQHKFTFKTAMTEQAALKHLGELADQDELTALQIIEQSIANGWKGFFPLKDNKHGQGQTTGDHRRSGNRISQADRERIAADILSSINQGTDQKADLSQ